MQWRWYVYIIECKNGSYYTGSTWQCDHRWIQHLSGLGSKYTALHGVQRLTYIEQCESFDESRTREKQIKGWTRAKKEKLIEGKWGKW